MFHSIYGYENPKFHFIHHRSVENSILLYDAVTFRVQEYKMSVMHACIKPNFLNPPQSATPFWRILEDSEN